MRMIFNVSRLIFCQKVDKNNVSIPQNPSNKEIKAYSRENGNLIHAIFQDFIILKSYFLNWDFSLVGGSSLFFSTLHFQKHDSND
jgi:hypothetical protein